MGLGPVPFIALIAITVFLAVLMLTPLRSGIRTDRQWIALVIVGSSAWFVVWPALDSGDHGLGGLALLGIWLIVFVPGAGLGLVAGFALARRMRWAAWLARAWVVLTLGWAALILIRWVVSPGSAPYTGPNDLYRAVFLGSHLLLLAASLVTIVLLARDRGVGAERR